MGFKFRGKNFQAWQEFEFEASGLTVLIGPSNEGKSSLARALKGTVRNQLDARYIRVGSDGMELTLEIDGHVVTAKRNAGGSTTYTIDTKPFKNLNKAIPEPLRDLLLNEVQIGDVTLDPVFARQGDPQFLIQEQPTALNAIIGAFASTERLEQGKREANRRIGEKSQEAKLLAHEKQESDAMELRLTELAERANLIQNEINRIGPEIRMEQEMVQELERLIRHRRRSERIAWALSQLEVPSTEELDHDYRLRHVLIEAIDARHNLLALGQVVEKITVPDTEPLVRDAKIAEQTAVLLSAKRTLDSTQRFFDKVEEVVAVWIEIVDEHKVLKALTERLEQERKRRSCSASFYLVKVKELTELATNAVMNAQSDVHIIRNVTNLIATRKRQRELAEELREAELAVAQASIEIEDLKHLVEMEEHLTTCPRCGERFIPEHPHHHRPKETQTSHA